MGFTKLDSGIVDSSVWSEPLATRVVWVTMLAKCDSKGMVKCARSGLFRATNVSPEEFDKAMASLEGPDPESRTKDNEGRRIVAVEGGYVVLNYIKYREFSYSENPESKRKRIYRGKWDKTGRVPKRPKNVRDISASASSLKSSLNSSLKSSPNASIDLPPDPLDVQATQLLIDLMTENNPTSSIIARLTPKRQSEWIKQSRLLRTADKRTPEQIEAIIRFSQEDSFWKQNILSMPKLREKWDQLVMKAKGQNKLSGIQEWLRDKEAEDGLA